MDALPDDVAASLVRSLGAYVRATPAQELPGSLRRFKGFRPKALGRHRADLFGMLDDDGFRAHVLAWLDDKRPPLSKGDREVLRLACSRPEGWVAELNARSRAPETITSEPAAGRETDERIDRERERTRRAKDETRRVREQLTRELQDQRARTEALRDEIDSLRERLRGAEEAKARAVTARDKAIAELERQRRKARVERADAKAQIDGLKAAARAAKRESTKLSMDAKRLERELLEARASSESGPGSADALGTFGDRRRRTLRAPLPPPKGLLEDAPETLDRWLDQPGVPLLVDGYNVSKAERGYGGLVLAVQRDRVVEEVSRLALRKDVAATVVFDGSVMPPGTSRRARGKVTVQYSKPPESADDHLVALLSELPDDPVVVVTNDRELQERVRALGATVATSTQLLALIRSSRGSSRGQRSAL